MTMQIHDVSLEVLRTLTLVRHIDADEAPARKRLGKICDITPSLGSSSVEKYFRSYDMVTPYPIVQRRQVVNHSEGGQ